LDIKLNRQFYESPAYKEYSGYMEVLDNILEEGKEKGLFRESVNNRVFRNLFFGGFTHLTTRWFILGAAKAIDMMQEIDQFVYLLCDAVLRKDPVIYELKERIVKPKSS
jgi:TetR/AcrR family fatty acid metabolism transcriptional regulator